MSKSLLIAVISLVIGVLTLVVGLYVLSTTPAEPVQPVSAPPVVLPQLPAQTATDIPDLPAEPGSEAWCERQMLLADSEWSDVDARTFADHCLY